MIEPNVPNDKLTKPAIEVLLPQLVKGNNKTTAKIKKDTPATCTFFFILIFLDLKYNTNNKSINACPVQS